jgi:chloramphenicol-sensitive protein RarD
MVEMDNQHSRFQELFERKMRQETDVVSCYEISGDYDFMLLIHAESRYWYLLPALGLVSAIGLSANLKSNQQIPVSVFAVLSYLEPTLLFLIAIFWLNTQVSLSDYFTYVPIWTSLILLGINGLRIKHH